MFPHAFPLFFLRIFRPYHRVYPCRPPYIRECDNELPPNPPLAERAVLIIYFAFGAGYLIFLCVYLRIIYSSRVCSRGDRPYGRNPACRTQENFFWSEAPKIIPCAAARDRALNGRESLVQWWCHGEGCRAVDGSLKTKYAPPRLKGERLDYESKKDL